ncbi:MAG: hypothetical protein FWH55_05365 [Oscillospiraceae bacterium]|nr:hypothetical protein [Oscillospiraceae bacterium]
MPIKQQGIPFTLQLDPFYSNRNITAIDEAALQIEHGQGSSGRENP